MATHSQQPRAIVWHSEGFMPQEASISCIGVPPRTIDQITCLNPTTSLNSMHRISVKLRVAQQLEEVLCEFWRCLIEKLKLDRLLGLISHLDREATAGSTALLLGCLKCFHTHPLVQQEAGSVLVLVVHLQPLQQQLVRSEVQDLVLCFDEGQGSTGFGLCKVATIVGHHMPQVLLVLCVKESFNGCLHTLMLRCQVFGRRLQELKGGILVLAIEVDMDGRRRRLLGCTFYGCPLGNKARRPSH
mmetsp:Transcript_95915/g.117554  ORF Transcript_95915/g.117554 Transcript_95915/m.117554 type:complete len:244 (+) Transcript_95915:329-1060(+)